MHSAELKFAMLYVCKTEASIMSPKIINKLINCN